MARLQGYGWLIVGAVLAVLVPLSGLDHRLLRLLDRMAPLPWSGLLLGLLLFWCSAAFYFRSHWGATMVALRQREQLIEQAAARLAGIESDAGRWGYLIRDNLVEVTTADPAPPQARLYLEGALAHADKIAEIGDRCAAVRQQLEVRGAGG